MFFFDVHKRASTWWKHYFLFRKIQTKLKLRIPYIHKRFLVYGQKCGFGENTNNTKDNDGFFLDNANVWSFCLVMYKLKCQEAFCMTFDIAFTIGPVRSKEVSYLYVLHFRIFNFMQGVIIITLFGCKVKYSTYKGKH